MRCISCEKLSFKIICNSCQNGLLKPYLNKRQIQKDFFVYSFYPYDDIKELINTKYKFYGDRVYNILANLTFKKFAKDFNFDTKCYIIPIDDHTKHDFSQTAILTKHLKSNFIKPIYGTLHSTNIVKYAGKDLEFRKQNPRKFVYTGDKNLKVILIDDLITTGLTMIEAKNTLEKYNCEVLFGLTLCDAKF